MTTTTTTGYAEAVRQALDDLPPATVSELVEGLDEHLAEVGVADLVSLFALLGSPERYAADLRASAGLSPRPAAPPSTPLPPPVPPPVAASRPGLAIRGRHVARVALAVIVLTTLVSLAAAKDTVDPLVVLAIVIAVGAGALILRWLYRVADVPARWATGALVALVALALAVATTAGAGHPRNEYTPYPFAAPTTAAGAVMLDLAGVETPMAVEIVRKMGLVAVVSGGTDAGSVIVSQEPPPGQYVAPGQKVRLITNRPDEPAPTFAPMPSTTVPPVGTTPVTTG
jgi:hypothetical protein